MVICLWYTHDPNFCSLSWFWRWKEHLSPLSPYLGLWRMLKVPDWGLASWSCLDKVTGLWYTHIPNIGSLSWFWRCKEHTCPFSPHLGLWRMLEVPDLGLASWSWFGYSHESVIWLWLLAWALAFGFGIDFCTVELRKYVDLGGFGFKWVRLKLKISQS